MVVAVDKLAAVAVQRQEARAVLAGQGCDVSFELGRVISLSPS